FCSPFSVSVRGCKGKQLLLVGKQVEEKFSNLFSSLSVAGRLLLKRGAKVRTFLPSASSAPLFFRSRFSLLLAPFRLIGSAKVVDQFELRKR
ncbi:hypothetical protein, partial [Hymenobacter sp. CRA2]|uniref:hypothetical protein n=1 Tax=Hymenobacter sp. CRA2 TaxID=1955620 RepID=UPI001C377620